MCSYSSIDVSCAVCLVTYTEFNISLVHLGGEEAFVPA